MSATAVSTSLPRLFAGVDRAGRLDLGEHLNVHGELPPLGREGGQALIDTVERARLRGRGGARFPTAIKLRAVARRRGPAVVVANGAEGEPASAKDRELLEIAPHLVIDGASLAAHCVGARTVVLYLNRDAVDAVDSVRLALRERARARTDPLPIRLVTAPDRYVAGEESALVHHLNGGPAKPTLVPPRPFERGVRRRPTLVSNVETLAHLALIARHGDEWFRELGTPDEPGSSLVTLSGAVVDPNVYEMALGTPMSDVLDAAGGPSSPLQALLVGGYFGSWVPAGLIDRLAVDDVHLRSAGAALGSGVIVALPSHACGIRETARIAGYLAGESSGQCGPCVHGLAAIAGALGLLAGGHAGPDAHEDLVRWCADVRGRGACAHPDGAVRLITSALAVFSDELDRHVQHGVCQATRARPALALPDIRDEPSWR